MQRIVYLVDDDQMVARSLEVLLTPEGIAFRHFESADRLLRALPELAPGCILMDIYMGGTDGIAALQALKRRGCAWPTIVMSGTAEDNDENLAWASGATDFLHKPLFPEEILAAIGNGFGQLAASAADRDARSAA